MLRKFWGIGCFALLFFIGFMVNRPERFNDASISLLLTPQQAFANGSEQGPDTLKAEKLTKKETTVEYSGSGEEGKCYYVAVTKTTISCKGSGSTSCKPDVSTNVGDQQGPVDCPETPGF